MQPQLAPRPAIHSELSHSSLLHVQRCSIMAGAHKGWQRTRQEVDARRRLFAGRRRAAGRLPGRRRAAPGAARQLLRSRRAHLGRKAQHTLLAVADLCARHLRPGLQVCSMDWRSRGKPQRQACGVSCLTATSISAGQLIDS